jgi:hypothetical protein
MAMFTRTDPLRSGDRMTLGERAAALYLSGAALSRGLTGDQVAALIVATVQTLGIDSIRALEDATRETNLLLLHEQITDREHRAAIRDLWGSDRHHQMCLGLANRAWRR